jgi:Tfp pilus assembly protein PilF
MGVEPSVQRSVLYAVSLLGLLSAIQLVETGFADQLNLKDGRSLEGKIVSADEEAIVLQVGTSRLKFSRDDIVSFEIYSRADMILKEADALTSKGLFIEALRKCEQGYEKTSDARIKSAIERIRPRAEAAKKEQQRRAISDRVNQHIERYFGFKDRANSKQALEELQKASETDPANTRVLELLALEYLDSGLAQPSAEARFLTVVKTLTDIDANSPGAKRLTDLYGARKRSIAAHADEQQRIAAEKQKIVAYERERRREQVESLINLAQYSLERGEYKSAYLFAERANTMVGSSQELLDLAPSIAAIIEGYNEHQRQERERQLWLQRVQSLRFYREVEKNPDKFAGTAVVWRGKVLKIEEEENLTLIQAYFVSTDVAWSDDCFFVVRKGVCKGLVKDDPFTVNGKILGKTEYISQALFHLTGIVVEGQEISY